MKTIPLKDSGVSTDVGTLAIGTTSVNLTPLPQQQSGYMVLDSNAATLAEEVYYTHSGSNPVTVSATTKQHTGGFPWLIDNTNGYYQELQGDDGWQKVLVNPTKGTGQTLVFANVDYTDRISVMDKIKYTDTTVKYGFVTAISYSTNTTVTITGGSDYTLAANPTAGTFRFSKCLSPVGFPANSNTFSPLGVNYSQATADQGTYTGATDLTNLAITITVPTGKRIRLTCQARLDSSVANDTAYLGIFEGATQIDLGVTGPLKAGGNPELIHLSTILAPTAGSHTYKLVSARSAGTGNITMKAAVNQIAFIMAEIV
jgi:hypothetical protein